MILPNFVPRPAQKWALRWRRERFALSAYEYGCSAPASSGSSDPQRHNSLIARLRLPELRDAGMPQVMEPYL